VTEGPEETIEGGVILRFPRDWVGPLEELVPFGPSADREPPSAPDFWGEDSAVLQDAVEVADAGEMPGAVHVPERPRRRRLEPLPLRRWLLPAGAVLAAVLFGVAALLPGSPSSVPRVRAMPFTVASIPSLAPAPHPVTHRPIRHRPTLRPQRHPRSARPRTASTPIPAAASPVTTPSPTYHPPPATSSNAGSSSQSGGAFTLGGP
jgi:hypothetical protein